MQKLFVVVFMLLVVSTSKAQVADSAAFTFRQINTKKLTGIFYQPTKQDPRISVIMFGGSDGGIGPSVKSMSTALAEQGYPTLALGYFRMDSLPAKLERIPIEYFINAVKFIKSQNGLK